MDCRTIRRFVYVYLDGEVDEGERREVEAHVRGCSSCRKSVEFEEWFLDGVKAKMSFERPPYGLKARILDEIARSDKPSQPWYQGWKLWAAAAPAAAAGLVLTVWALVGPSMNRMGTPRAMREAVFVKRLPPTNHVVDRERLVKAVIDESIRKHRRNLPLDVTSSDFGAVRSFFRGRFNFPIKLPQFSHKLSLIGGRLTDLGSKESAYIMYQLRRRRLSLLVTPERAPRGRGNGLKDGELRLSTERA